MIRVQDGPWFWVNAEDGDITTPDGMDRLLELDRSLLVGRTASTIVLRDQGREVTYHRVREADYV